MDSPPLTSFWAGLPAIFKSQAYPHWAFSNMAVGFPAPSLVPAEISAHGFLLRSILILCSASQCLQCGESDLPWVLSSLRDFRRVVDFSSASLFIRMKGGHPSSLNSVPETMCPTTFSSFSLNWFYFYLKDIYQHDHEKIVFHCVFLSWSLLFISFPDSFLERILWYRRKGFKKRIHSGSQNDGTSSCWFMGVNGEISFLFCVQWHPVGSLKSAAVVVFIPQKCKHYKSGLPAACQESWLLNTHHYTAYSGY